MNEPILAMPREIIVDKEAFGADKLNRVKFGETLTRYIDRLKMGAVISIDAPWGHGKTWFALNWKEQLKGDGHAVIYIDAFKSDYMEDPFLLLAAEITDLLESKQRAAFIVKAKNVALAIAPLAMKLTVQGAGKMLLGSADLPKEFNENAEKAINGANDTLGKLIADRIKNHKAESKKISAFREALQSFAKASSKPIVIIVDELDRCQPTFAVRLLERIKHLFDVENVVFVLCMNKKQMGQAIRGVYGHETDAHTYLEKFLNFTFSLNQLGINELMTFIYTVFEKYEMQRNSATDDFLETLSVLAEIFELTPRQIERCIALLALAHPVLHRGTTLAQVVVLKVARPDEFVALLKGDHETMRSLERQLLLGAAESSCGHKAKCIKFLQIALGAAGNPNNSAKQLALREYSLDIESFQYLVQECARSIDVPIR